MSPAVEQLVRDTIDLTGAEPPDLMADDAPVLSDDALASAREDGFYLVGLIGGKDVGKSALVNALAGGAVTTSTSYGPGTEGVIAYAHRSQEPALRALLEREVPGRYRIVTHDLPPLRRQVLLDLPDIDSVYQSHLAVTRTMLRHMLYPVWVQSVEKYADLQPQQMLAKVAAGNDARNFLFCLNKADQLEGGSGEGAGAAGGATQASRQTDSGHDARAPQDLGELNRAASPLRELSGDFAARIARTLSLPAPPEVFLVSARYPQRYDLPRLAALLSREKSQNDVRESKGLAARRQDWSLLEWLGTQRLSERAESLRRLREEAEELAGERLAVPLVERVVPRITDDPGSRAALADDILNERVARWPLINLAHTLLAPLFALVRTMGAKNASTLQSADALVEFYLRADGWSASAAVQSVFAPLRQSHPLMTGLYAARKLWDDLPAHQAAANLSRHLADAVERQRAVARERLAGRHGIIAPLARWILTIGALLWFPIVQPVLQDWLNVRFAWYEWQPIARAIVRVLGADYLLKSAGFLAIYYIVLWLALRWNTQRRVAKMLARWKLADDPNPDLNLAAQSLEWVESLTDPIRAAHERAADLANRADKLRTELRNYTSSERHWLPLSG